MKQKTIFALLLILALLPGLCACKDSDVPELLEPVEVTYQTATVFRGDLARLEYADGFIAAETEILGFENGGKLKAVYVRPGDQVQAGDLLAELDTESLEETLSDVQNSMYRYELSYAYSMEQAECDLASARLRWQEASGGKTQIELNAEKTAIQGRITALKQEITALDGTIASLESTIAALETPAATPAPSASPDPAASPSAAPDNSAALAEARAALTAAQTDRSAKQEQLTKEETALRELEEKLTVLAELDLTIRQTENTIVYLQENYGLQAAQYGENVAQLQAEIDAGKLYALHNGTVSAVLQQTPGGSIGAGALVHIALEGTEYVCYNGERDFSRTQARVQGRLGAAVYDLTLMPYTDAEYRSLSQNGMTPTGRFALPDGTSARVGDYVQLVFYANYREDVLCLPVNAVYTGSGYAESFVYRIVDGEKVYTRVEVGLMNDAYAEIKSGLEEGDVVYVQE